MNAVSGCLVTFLLFPNMFHIQQKKRFQKDTGLVKQALKISLMMSFVEYDVIFSILLILSVPLDSNYNILPIKLT